MKIREVDASEAAFLRLAGVIRRLFHELRVVAETATPPAGGFNASHRAVLESLTTGGAQTVPALARARPVARQHIQVLVNELLGMGLVELRPNPAHRRSPLVAVTRAGARRFEQIRRAESTLLRGARLPLTAAEMNAVTAQLTLLSSGLTQLTARRRSRGRK